MLDIKCGLSSCPLRKLQERTTLVPAQDVIVARVDGLLASLSPEQVVTICS
jgi:hypothetical protein